MLECMLSWSRRHALVVAGLVATAASAWLSRGRAAAQTRYENEPLTLAQLRDKVVDLEARLRVVEQYMKEDCEYPYEAVGPGVMRVKQRCLAVVERSQNGQTQVSSKVRVASFAPAAAASESAPARRCQPPYILDAHKVKHFSERCLERQATAESVPKMRCDPPYTIDSSGVKSYKQGCL